MAEQRTLEAERAVLLPCPFCQSTNLSIESNSVQPDDFHDAHVVCDECDATGRHAMTLEGWLSSKDEARAEAVIAWNRRAPPALGEDGLPVLEWQFRIPPGTDYGSKEHIGAMKAEIADLRAQFARQSQHDAVAADRRACAFSPESGAETAATRMGAGLDRVREIPLAPTSPGAQLARQGQHDAVQSVIACARRVYSKFGSDSDWSEWRDLCAALQEFDAARQGQQPARRASVDTPELRVLLDIYRDADRSQAKSARAALIAHINAWGSAGSGAGAAPEQYTCAGKGGEYELIGRADGAGYVRGGVVMVYRDAATGALFYRTPADFNARMEKISAAPSNQSPAEEA